MRRFQELEVTSFFLTDGKMGIQGKRQRWVRTYRFTRKQLEGLKLAIAADLNLGELD